MGKEYQAEKNMTWAEYVKKKKLDGIKKEKERAPWICKVCGKSAYLLKAKDRKLHRTCRYCEDEVIIS